MYQSLYDFFIYMVTIKLQVQNALIDSTFLGDILSFINGGLTNLFRIFNNENVLVSEVTYQVLAELLMLGLTYLIFYVIIRFFIVLIKVINNLINDNEWGVKWKRKRK